MVRCKHIIKIIFLSIIILYGCKHASIRDIQGKIVDENGDALEGAVVILQYHIPAVNGPNREWKYDSLVTDASGKYRFNRRKKMRWEHWLIVRHPSYYTNEVDLGYIQNPTNVIMSRPAAFVSVRIKKNTNTASKIKMKLDDFVFLTQYNLPFDSTAVRSKQISANLNYSITWDVNDTGHFSANMNLKKGENYTYVIEYD